MVGTFFRRAAVLSKTTIHRRGSRERREFTATCSRRRIGWLFALQLKIGRLACGSHGGQDFGEDVIHAVGSHIEDAEALGGVW